jgi:hypothetical protein
MYTRVLERFAAFRRVPLKVVAVTALASYALQIGAILQGQPLYIIALVTLLPWIPLVFVEGLWKVQHYSWLAVFAVVTVLQVGHLGEHTFQVVQLRFLDGTLACPPPKDTAASAQRAIDMGLRSADQGATGRSATAIQQPDGKVADHPRLDASGRPVSGPPACGVFGQLDFELVHLVWDTLVWLGALVLLTKFPRNIWLWIAMIAASAHEVEHLFLGAIFYLDTDKVFSFKEQLWATTVNGNNVTAIPAGVRDTVTTFYEAGGKTGILGKNGLVERVILGTTDKLPLRPYLHYLYNSAVVIPTVISFLVQVRKAYDQYLAQALPDLTEEQLVRATAKLENMKFPAGAVIVRQGDPADRFYIIVRGEVEVIRQQPDGTELAVARLGSGAYFGEIGLLHGGKRIATVRAATDVEVMALDRETFSDLMTESDLSRGEVDRVVRHRVMQVRSMETGTPAGRGP